VALPEESVTAHNQQRAHDASTNGVIGLTLGVAWDEPGDLDDVEALLARAAAPTGSRRRWRSARLVRELPQEVSSARVRLARRRGDSLT
jgi:hypothetical protein